MCSVTDSTSAADTEINKQRFNPILSREKFLKFLMQFECHLIFGSYALYLVP